MALITTLKEIIHTLVQFVNTHLKLLCFYTQNTPASIPDTGVFTWSISGLRFRRLGVAGGAPAAAPAAATASGTAAAALFLFIEAPDDEPDDNRQYQEDSDRTEVCDDQFQHTVPLLSGWKSLPAGL